MGNPYQRRATPTKVEKPKRHPFMIANFIQHTEEVLNFMQLQHDLLVACSYHELPEHLTREIYRTRREYSAIFNEKTHDEKHTKRPIHWITKT